MLKHPQTDTSNLLVPAKLGNSIFLKAISNISGKDYVGRDATASSLGLASSYTVNLLTSCAIASSGTTCSSPHVGFTFSPNSEMKLDGTALQGSYSDDYLDALSSYTKVSPFLSGAYILSILLLFASPLLALPSTRKAIIPAALISALATIFLLAAGVTAGLTFRKLNDAFNTNFNTSGLSSSVGTLAPRLGYVAFGFSLTSTLLIGLRACYAPRASAGRRGAALSGKATIGRKRTFMERLPAWRQPQYVQVEKQAAVARSAEVHRRLDADWVAEDDYAPGGQGGIAMRNLVGGNKRTHDVNTAYEPFARTE